MTNYEQALAYLKTAASRGSVLGLERISRLAELLGDPQDKVKTIHISDQPYHLGRRCIYRLYCRIRFTFYLQEAFSAFDSGFSCSRSHYRLDDNQVRGTLHLLPYSDTGPASQDPHIYRNRHTGILHRLSYAEKQGFFGTA